MIRLLDRKDILACATLLNEAFPHAYTMKEAHEEVETLLEGEAYVTLVYEADEGVIGFVGARPQYGTTGWELHPLVVFGEKRGKGYGKRLVYALEDELVKRGGLMVYLGTDDEMFQTSLSEGDLFEDTFDKIKAIKNYQNHPFSFYERVGYKIVGVLPDANGYNKPDIYMAKRIGENPWKK